MSSIQIIHGEFDFEELCVEAHPRDLCDGFIIQFEHGMVAFHFEVVAVVCVLGELETTEYELLRKINDNRHILLGNGGRIDDPCALNRHVKFIGKIRYLNDST